MPLSYADQLKLADNFLSKVASSTGSLEQCRVGWGKKLEDAQKTGLAKETFSDILKALKPTATQMQKCEGNIKQTDRARIKKMINELSGLAHQTVSADNIWKTNFDAGAKDVEFEINSKSKPITGVAHNYNVQAELIAQMIDITDSVNHFIRQIRKYYDIMNFDAKQQSFMVQYTQVLDNFTKSRIAEFDSIKRSLQLTKDQLSSYYLKIKLIAQQYSSQA